MRRILVVSTRLPYPVVGGERLRLYYILKYLSFRYEVSLFCLVDDFQKRDTRNGLEFLSGLEVFRLTRVQSLFNCLMLIFNGRPFQVNYYYSSKLKRHIRQKADAFDLGVAHLVRSAVYFESIDLPLIVEFTDAISLNYNLMSNDKSLPLLYRFFFKIETERLKKYERSLVGSVRKGVVVAELDRLELIGGGSVGVDKILVVKNGFTLPNQIFNGDNHRNHIIFIGNCTSIQNFNGVYHFAKTILPNILEREPSIRLLVIGRIPPKSASILKKLDGVIVTGEVEDIGIVCGNGFVGICPIELGAGMQNKVLDYIALGLPVVLTEMCSRGFKEVVHGHNVLVAQDSEMFEENILLLYNKIINSSDLTINAKREILSNYTWEREMESYFKIIDEL